MQSSSWFWHLLKCQLVSKENCQVVNSSTKRNEWICFSTIRPVFVRFLEEIEDTKKTSWNYLTFSKRQNHEEDFANSFNRPFKCWRELRQKTLLKKSWITTCPSKFLELPTALILNCCWRSAGIFPFLMLIAGRDGHNEVSILIRCENIFRQSVLEK